MADLYSSMLHKRILNDISAFDEAGHEFEIMLNKSVESLPHHGLGNRSALLDMLEMLGIENVDLTEGSDIFNEFKEILARLKAYVADAKAMGITITVEDFGGTANPGSSIKYLKRFLAEIPDLRFALDTGNLYYAGRGESILEMLEHAKGRIAHVHLKDQKPEANRTYETLGLGAVPNEAIVKRVNAAGYDGWYTLENPVGDTYTDTVRQVAVLKSWLNGK